jgi:uncharacterized membrane protein
MRGAWQFIRRLARRVWQFIRRLARGARRFVHSGPADLQFVVGFVVVTGIALVLPLESPLLRHVLGLPFVLFVPGYVLVALLFPGASDAEHSTVGDNQFPAEIDWPERLALSVGISIALLPIVGLLIAPFGYSETTVVGSLAGLILLATIGATIRRSRLPPANRLHVPIPRPRLTRPESAADVANLVLVIGIVFATSSLAYAVATPSQAETYSTLYIGTETESGELIASNYPSEFTVGEPQSLVVGVENAEDRYIEYTIVAELQRVRDEGDTLTVVETEELERFHLELDPGETWRRQHALEPGLVGTDLRVQYLLYLGSAPVDTGDESAYRTASLWIDVAERTE